MLLLFKVLILIENIHLSNWHRIPQKPSRNPLELQKYRLIIASLAYNGYDKNLSVKFDKDQLNIFLDELCKPLSVCRDLLSEDGSLWIIAEDIRTNYGRLMIPHRMVSKVMSMRYIFREDIICHFNQDGQNSLRYKSVFFFSKNPGCYTNMDAIRESGNEVLCGKNKQPPNGMMQFEPFNQNKEKIANILEKIRSATSSTPVGQLPSTSEISLAYGYDPEKYCPTCYRKFKRHATRKRIGEHKHYPVFAVCNPAGKNPGNYWDLGKYHVKDTPTEQILSRIVQFATEEGNRVTSFKILNLLPESVKSSIGSPILLTQLL